MHSLQQPCCLNVGRLMINILYFKIRSSTNHIALFTGFSRAYGYAVTKKPWVRGCWNDNLAAIFEAKLKAAIDNRGVKK